MRLRVQLARGLQVAALVQYLARRIRHPQSHPGFVHIALFRHHTVRRAFILHHHRYGHALTRRKPERLCPQRGHQRPIRLLHCEHVHVQHLVFQISCCPLFLFLKPVIRRHQ